MLKVIVMTINNISSLQYKKMRRREKLENQSGLKLVLAYAFEELKLHRLEANIQPNNAPSIRLVKANRFRKEGYSERYLNINGEWRDFERWAITYEDWE